VSSGSRVSAYPEISPNNLVIPARIFDAPGMLILGFHSAFVNQKASYGAHHRKAL
jgi:hypothetical protein